MPNHNARRSNARVPREADSDQVLINAFPARTAVWAKKMNLEHYTELSVNVMSSATFNV